MTDPRRAGENGFALILALLALMLLTFLGLTLATSTSTELRIATNYRWQQQALYNAEAGIEAGRQILSGIPNWTTILPTKRLTGWRPTATVTATRAGANISTSNADQWGNPTRNWENGPCDKHGAGVGYGAILDDTTGAAPYQYKSTLFGANLNGAFTLWVRRPVVAAGDGNLQDYVGNGDEDHLVLVAEGIAPYTGNQLRAANVSNAAVQVIEVLVSKVNPLTQSTCSTSRSGQAGQGAGNANYAGCDAVTGSAVQAALGGNSATEFIVQ